MYFTVSLCGFLELVSYWLTNIIDVQILIFKVFDISMSSGYFFTWPAKNDIGLVLVSPYTEHLKQYHQFITY